MRDPEEVLKENPGSVIFARYAERLAEEGKIVEALEILNNGIEANPYYATGYSVLAKIYSMEGSQEKSVEQLEKALSLEPQAPRDLLNLGKYIIKDQPERAKDYYWAAQRYEPEVSEESHLPEDELTLTPDTEHDPTELITETEVPKAEKESIEESAGVEKSVMEETQEDTEISLTTEADEIQSIEEGEAAEPIEETEFEESEETIQDEGISYDINLMPDKEEALGDLVKESEIPEDIEEGIEESKDVEEIIMEETQEDTDISLSAEADEVQPLEEKETEEPAEEVYAEAEKDITGEISTDLTGLIGDAQGSEETTLESLEQPLEQEEGETTGETEEILDEIDEEELPGYSEMLEGSEPVELDSSEKKQEETSVLEIEEDEEYDVSKLEYDLSNREIEEPVITEEERAELLALEESSQEVDRDIEIEKYGDAQNEDSDLTGLASETKPEIEIEESDKTLTGDLYGDLSKDEIDVLSDTDTEPDDVEKDLETETKEGIDYSDILYGQEPAIESEEALETVSMEEIQPEEALETEIDIEDISPPEMKDENIEDTPIDTENVLVADHDESEPESVTSDLSEDNVKVAEDMSNGFKDFELSFTDQDIQDVENSPLNELIDDYVDALKDYSEEPEQGKIDYSEEGKPPESLTENKEVELDLTGDKPLDEEAGEYTADTAETTATMAEIFVSQGLITRAIEIYKVLVEKEPDDEDIKSRLEELHKMLDE